MSDELQRLRDENERLKEERRQHDIEWQGTVMAEFGKVNAQISGLRLAVEGDMGVKVRLTALEAESAERKKKADRSWLLWIALIPVLGDILMRFNEWLQRKP